MEYLVIEYLGKHKVQKYHLSVWTFHRVPSF